MHRFVSMRAIPFKRAWNGAVDFGMRKTSLPSAGNLSGDLCLYNKVDTVRLKNGRQSKVCLGAKRRPYAQRQASNCARVTPWLSFS